ncbi:histone deacetylase 6 isoform X4 [Eutrema salsugineum]|uniref:histone deacetylase 6 isoform X4 n=1 Tax=Eutrema salsugineum TaxID=72664 RepID=UPI000CED11B1|nr:histone deacetylase 6 isoform X4 [Eutrema salsugineum]
MANKATSSSSSQPEAADDETQDWILGAGSGWVEARTSCDHLNSLSSDLVHLPNPYTPCSRCENPVENWLCLCCKEVLCSRFVNRHMLMHHQQTGHCLALSYRTVTCRYGASAAKRISMLRSYYS